MSKNNLKQKNISRWIYLNPAEREYHLACELGYKPDRKQQIRLSPNSLHRIQQQELKTLNLNYSTHREIYCYLSWAKVNNQTYYWVQQQWKSWFAECRQNNWYYLSPWKSPYFFQNWLSLTTSELPDKNPRKS